VQFKMTNDGGGPWGGGGGGPFGSRQPPAMEDVIRKGQERLKSLIPGGFSSYKGIVLVVLLGVVIWLVTGFFRVQPNQQAIQLVFGKPFGKPVEPGLHYNPGPNPTEMAACPRHTNALWGHLIAQLKHDPIPVEPHHLDARPTECLLECKPFVSQKARPLKLTDIERVLTEPFDCQLIVHHTDDLRVRSR